MEEIEKIKPPTVPDSIRFMSFNLAREIHAISGVNEELCSTSYEDQKDWGYDRLGEFVYLYLIKKLGMRHTLEKVFCLWPKINKT